MKIIFNVFLCFLLFVIKFNNKFEFVMKFPIIYNGFCTSTVVSILARYFSSMLCTYRFIAIFVQLFSLIDSLAALIKRN